MSEKSTTSRNSREGKYYHDSSRKRPIRFNRQMVKKLKLNEMGLGHSGPVALFHVMNYLRNHGIK